MSSAMGDAWLLAIGQGQSDLPTEMTEEIHGYGIFDS
jgi:hypothetical protein